MIQTVKATKAQIKFAEECLDILYGSRDIDGKQRLLLQTKSIGEVDAVFKMTEYILHDDCGTTCCIAGAHRLVHGDGSDWDLLTRYLSSRGINVSRDHKLSSTPDDLFYNFCLLDDWSSNIDNAIARLEFVVKTKEVLVVDVSIVVQSNFYLDEEYMDYVNSRLRELIYAPRFSK